MTTVAFDGKTIASDTRQVGDYIDPNECKKIYKVNGDYIAGAGEVQQIQAFRRWYKNQKADKPDPDHMGDFEAIIVKDGKAYYVASMCEITPLGSPCAIGTGGDYAMAAMLGGADAKEAVRIAMRLDPYTGGRVRSVSI